MIAIIDYDAGNLKSVEKALAAVGQESVITRDFQTILSADKVILPGVGAFSDAMHNLKKYDLDQVIREVAEKKRYRYSVSASDSSFYLKRVRKVRV